MKRIRDLTVALLAVFTYSAISMLSGVTGVCKDISGLVKGQQELSLVFGPDYCYADDDNDDKKGKGDDGDADKKDKKDKDDGDDDDSTDGVGDPEQGADMHVDVGLGGDWKEVE